MRSNLRRNVRRAFTLSELMIGLGISSLVMVTIAGLIYMAARESKDILGQTRMRSARTQAIDQIRYRLANARIGTIVISNENHDIAFIDPNRSQTVSSKFSFNPTNMTLYFDDLDGEGDSAYPVAKGPIDIQFELQDSGAVVQITVKSNSSLQYRQIDEQEGQEAVYLRNI